MSEKKKTFNIYVYGTLKKGKGLHYFLEDTEYIGTYRLSGFQMYDNISYPYAVISDNENDTIEAELYCIDKNTLERLDRVEGVPTHYKRISISRPTK